MSQAMAMCGYPDNMQFGRSAPVAGPYQTKSRNRLAKEAEEDQIKLEEWQRKLNALVKEGHDLMRDGLHFSAKLSLFGPILVEMEGFSKELDKADFPLLWEYQK